MQPNKDLPKKLSMSFSRNSPKKNKYISLRLEFGGEFHSYGIYKHPISLNGIVYSFICIDLVTSRRFSPFACLTVICIQHYSPFFYLSFTLCLDKREWREKVGNKFACLDKGLGKGRGGRRTGPL